MTDKPAKMGRPTLKTPELCQQICDLIASGQSLRAICRGDSFPHVATVLRWAGEDANFRDQYARAMEARQEHLFEETLEIADDSSDDVRVVVKDGVEREVLDREHVERSKLRVATRQWALGKMNPKKYGNRVMADVNATLDLDSIIRDSLAKPAEGEDGQ